jgi:hypothetical protein
MATTLTSRGKAFISPGIILEYGDFSSTDTTAVTVSFSGGYVIALMVFDTNGNLCGSAGTSSTAPSSALALSGSVTSVVITPGGAITAGRFLCIHGGS